MPMLPPMAWHEQKSHVLSPFDHLDLTNGIMPFMTQLALCDTDMRIHDIACPEKKCCTFFVSYLDLWNALVLLTVTLASHDADTSANSVKY